MKGEEKNTVKGGDVGGNFNASGGVVDLTNTAGSVNGGTASEGFGQCDDPCALGNNDAQYDKVKQK